MEIEQLVTKDDLRALKKDLLEALTLLVTKQAQGHGKPYLRSKEVRQLLGISNGTLQSLRIKKILNPTKVEGVYYYKATEIMDLLNAGTE